MPDTTLATTALDAPISPGTAVPEKEKIGTAADLVGSPKPQAQETPCDVNAFRVGMRVTHPKYGLGKVAALSGPVATRTATIHFATAGVRKFRLKESPLRPVGTKP